VEGYELFGPEIFFSSLGCSSLSLDIGKAGAVLIAVLKAFIWGYFLLQMVYAQSFFWCRNPVLLSPPPYVLKFLRKPSFFVLANFFPWCLKIK
jgi:hypothetical protein